MERWPSGASRRSFPRSLISLCDSGEQRDHGIERLDLNGQRLRECSCADGAEFRSKPVAGISCGLVTEFNGDVISRYTLLTDIIGEDYFGDMDFKLCGTQTGVTGFQLDLKLPGIPLKLMEEAIYRARDARFEILKVMNLA